MRPTIARRGDVVTVSIPYLDGPKKYWLIISDKPLRNDEQEFRDFIWKGAANRTNIVLFAPLAPTYQRLSSDTKDERPEIKLVLPYDLARRAYIYHDFPTPVFDGGFYYTVDIPSYIKQ